MSGGVFSYSLGAIWITQSILSIHHWHAFIEGGDVKVAGGGFRRGQSLVSVTTSPKVTIRRQDGDSRRRLIIIIIYQKYCLMGKSLPRTCKGCNTKLKKNFNDHLKICKK